MQSEVPQKSTPQLSASEFANLDNCYSEGNAVNRYAELGHSCKRESSALVCLSGSIAAQKSSAHPLPSSPIAPFWPGQQP